MLDNEIAFNVKANIINFIFSSCSVISSFQMQANEEN